MIRITVMDRAGAGEARAFFSLPIRVGRGSGNELRVEKPGVWEEHCVVERAPGGGVRVRALGGARWYEGERVRTEMEWRNGMELALGSCLLRLELDEAGQKGQGWRELVVWALVGLVLVVELGLIGLLW